MGPGPELEGADVRGKETGLFSLRIAGALRPTLLIASLLVGPTIAGAATDAVTAPTQPAQASSVSTPPVAVAARVDRSGTASRLEFDLSRPTDVVSTVLENPDRIVLESGTVDFRIPADTGRSVPAGGLIRSFRFGHFAPGRSRIVIDLAGPAHIQKIGVASIAGGDPSRLTIQLTKCDRATFHGMAASAAPAPSAAPTDGITEIDPTADPRPVVVIDPGHGGIDPGARGIGNVVEKRVVFDFAAVLAERLRSEGRFRVVMTRSDDTFVSLGDRVKLAREAKASLFISLHADTLASSADVTGATVYIASDKASDAEAAHVAETENKADEVAGLELAPDATDVSDILFDLTRRETRTYSHAYQRTLAGYWQKIAKLNKNPERAAGFKVLQAPDVPSILLELGYLSNEKDVAALTSAEWRDKAATSVAGSIDAFFDSRRTIEEAGPVNLKTGDPDKMAVVVLRPHL